YSVDGVQTRFVHGDVKPDNILLSVQGGFFLYDLGCCKPEKDLAQGEGVLVGTPQYLSPEHFLSKVRDVRADQFSLGITLYELLTGKNPFDPDNSPDDVSAMYDIGNTDPIPSSRYNKLILSPLENLVLKALSKNPADRFANIQAMTSALVEVYEFGKQPFSKEIGAACRSLPYGYRTSYKPPSSETVKSLVCLLERMNEEFSFVQTK
ncbi:MAG: protein kinase, partial [Candidatus Woesearchaeota archaeon]|nr:protein kinase [Candidatus Woesearchaeota archaeon]